jgi:hypothetical protein
LEKARIALYLVRGFKIVVGSGRNETMSMGIYILFARSNDRLYTDPSDADSIYAIALAFLMLIVYAKETFLP